jgi:hypothetical protein
MLGKGTQSTRRISCGGQEWPGTAASWRLRGASCSVVRADAGRAAMPTTMRGATDIRGRTSATRLCDHVEGETVGELKVLRARRGI